MSTDLTIVHGTKCQCEYLVHRTKYQYIVTSGLDDANSANETIDEADIVRTAVERGIAIIHGGLTAVGNDYRIKTSPCLFTSQKVCTPRYSYSYSILVVLIVRVRLLNDEEESILRSPSGDTKTTKTRDIIKARRPNTSTT